MMCVDPRLSTRGYGRDAWCRLLPLCWPCGALCGGLVAIAGYPAVTDSAAAASSMPSTLRMTINVPTP